MWKPAAQRLRPVRPPARPASARSSSGRPPASASLGRHLLAGRPYPTDRVSHPGSRACLTPRRACT
eukprot:scaffold84557_cov56-Phaeocystis_antarctica.AAC.4